MAASDYFDLPDVGSMIESAMSGYNYTRYSQEGTKVHNVHPLTNETEDIFIPNKQKTMSKINTKEKQEFTLPELDEITGVSVDAPPRDLVVVSIPKMGKGSILGNFTQKYKALILDLEKGGYEYIPARKMSSFISQETTLWESFQNYTKYRKLLLENKGKYDYLIVDGLSDLDALSEIGGTLAYMDTIIGKKFNRNTAGEKLTFGDQDWKSVLTLPDGAGYQHTRKWFLDQIEYFRQIAPFRIYAAHITDKYIKDNGKEEVIGAEIALTGQLKRIFASKVTALAKLVADGDERYLNFDVLNDSIVAGSRAPKLKGRILISKKEKDDSITTYWETIYATDRK